jgi:uncharacterized protein YqeY
MSQRQKITEEIKIALKAHQQVKLATLRMLLAAIHNEEIAKQRELMDEEVIEIIQRQVKTHKESITAFRQGNREDLVAKESEELEILNSFLPQQLSVAELQEEIKKVIKELDAGPADFGKVMKEVMVRVKGRAEGGTVSQMVKEFLGNN